MTGEGVSVDSREDSGAVWEGDVGSSEGVDGWGGDVDPSEGAAQVVTHAPVHVSLYMIMSPHPLKGQK